MSFFGYLNYHNAWLFPCEGVEKVSTRAGLLFVNQKIGQSDNVQNKSFLTAKLNDSKRWKIQKIGAKTEYRCETSLFAKYINIGLREKSKYRYKS